jgi:hypothetical protein
MRSLARDIQFTLFIKFSLLFILWFVCFKGVGKPSMSTQQWLFGPTLQTHHVPSTTDGAPKHTVIN